MHLALIGVGGAGIRIADRVLGYEREERHELSGGDVIALDTDRDALDSLEHVPGGNRVLLGELHPDADGDGVTGDIDLAVEVARDDLDEVRRALDPIPMYDLDGVVLVAGLAGGTGSGAGAVVLEELTSFFEAPVYALGVLPADAEGDGAALTTARALLSYVPTADNVLAFDNESWFKPERDDDENRRRANDEIATRLVTLLGAGGADDAIIPENCIDPSDLVLTLETGGVSTIGYASTDLEGRRGLLAWLRGLIGRDSTEPANPAQVRDLVRRAAKSRLTLPCDIESAERIAIIVSGPPDVLSRKGFENARHWLEEETGVVEIRAGDEPRKSASSLSAAVLFSNVTTVDRIEAIKERAVATHHERLEEGFGWDTPEAS